jgi:phosphomannomutase
LSLAGHIPEKDGILAGLLVVEMLAKMKKPLSQIFKQMEDEIGVFVQERINLVVPAHKKDKIIADLKEHPPAAIDGQAVQKVTTIDGVKIVLADGSWFLVRPSGTEPLVRVYLEASSEQKLQELKRELTQRFITEE